MVEGVHEERVRLAADPFDALSGARSPSAQRFAARIARQGLHHVQVPFAFDERFAGFLVLRIATDLLLAIDDLATALDDFFNPYGWPWFAVTDPDGRFLGLLAEETVRNVAPAQLETEVVADHMAADGGEAHMAIKAEAPLEDALDREELPRLGGLMAVDSDGRVVGLLTAQSVQRSMGADGQWPAV